MNPLCIYHGNCSDGIASAVVVKKALSEEEVEFHGGVYGETPPDVSGRTVIMVDFSYKRDVLLNMAASAERILILDHHKSAMLELTDLPDNVTVEFDINRSGAMITWDYFFAEKEPPVLLRHIQDRDLWRFNMAGTREIMAYMFSQSYDIDHWHDLIFTSDIDVLKALGAAIDKHHLKNLNEFITAAAYMTNIAGYEVPVLNCPYFMASDAGHIMGVEQPFAATYYYDTDGIVFSLRSAPDGVDVSEIAQAFGGGGHQNSAGFKISREDLHKVANKIN